ncbi:hypothetical protein PC128_g11600 [Phytophthora cactorum]|nr:hypothetical protein PC128_g11600 [Phytophthora cactorum]
MTVPKNANDVSSTARDVDTVNFNASDKEQIQNDDTARKVHLSLDDYVINATWSEEKKNFESVYGSKKTMNFGGEPKLT